MPQEPHLFAEGRGEPVDPGLPDDLDGLRDAARTCTRCDLYRDATQTVFGAGPARARLMLVGEQPGDREDTEGEPFVGPAGGVLDRALEEAGIARDDTYVTNMVKHFKFTRRGKRRIHQTPDKSEVEACSVWLAAETRAVDPELIVPLGATAAKGLLGSSFRVTKQRGQLVERDGRRYAATVHPSSILRVPSERRDAAYADLVDDLRHIKDLLGP
jgi:uracil-DNA glycosylase